MSTDPGTEPPRETLAQETLFRLHHLELLAESAPSEPEAYWRAGVQMRTLAVVWRGLLVEHHAAADGCCATCCPWCGPRPVWPCGVWRSAHRSLGRYMIKAVEQPASQTASELPESARCPSPVPAAPDAGTGLPQAAPDPVAAAPVGCPSPGLASRAGPGLPESEAALAWCPLSGVTPRVWGVQ